jgi:hypothetical protein
MTETTPHRATDLVTQLLSMRLPGHTARLPTLRQRARICFTASTDPYPTLGL